MRSSAGKRNEFDGTWIIILSLVTASVVPSPSWQKNMPEHQSKFPQNVSRLNSIPNEIELSLSPIIWYRTSNQNKISLRRNPIPRNIWPQLYFRLAFLCVGYSIKDVYWQPSAHKAWRLRFCVFLLIEIHSIEIHSTTIQQQRRNFNIILFVLSKLGGDGWAVNGWVGFAVFLVVQRSFPACLFIT